MPGSSFPLPLRTRFASSPLDSPYGRKVFVTNSKIEGQICCRSPVILRIAGIIVGIVERLPIITSHKTGRATIVVDGGDARREGCYWLRRHDQKVGDAIQTKVLIIDIRKRAVKVKEPLLAGGCVILPRTYD